MDIAHLEQALANARLRVKDAIGRLPDGGEEANAEFAHALDEQARAERSLASAKGEEYAEPVEVGVRWSTGAPCPHLISSGHRSFVAFYLAGDDPNWDGTYVRVVDPTSHEINRLGLAEFKQCRAVKLGPPNDEVLHGHPLHGRGIAGYGTYVIENSPWLGELIEINRVHDRFDPQAWADAKHFLLVFHDETVEAIASGIEVETFETSMPALLSRAVDSLWDDA